MHYETLFFSNLASTTVYALCVAWLALHFRRVKGMSWFAAALLLLWSKLLLQGLEGCVSPLLSGLVANELYLLHILAQMLGIHWFVRRRALPTGWVSAALFLDLALYTTLFLMHLPYTGNLLNIPFVLVCLYSAWILFHDGKGELHDVSRLAGVLLCCEALVAAYRAVLTNQRYMRPWETANATTDPRWLYSLATMFFLSTFLVMCYLWLLVKELQQELSLQARTDPLTGALNRRALEEGSLQEASRSMRSGRAFSMIMVDIDRFKLINDEYGHAAGDLVLQTLVRQVQSALRCQDKIARTGGEEFTLLLPETGVHDAFLVAERIRQLVEALEVSFEGKTLNLTVSIGVAQFDPAQGGWETIMRRADLAMYEAKEHGRNLVSIG